MKSAQCHPVSTCYQPCFIGLFQCFIDRLYCIRSGRATLLYPLAGVWSMKTDWMRLDFPGRASCEEYNNLLNLDRNIQERQLGNTEINSRLSKQLPIQNQIDFCFIDVVGNSRNGKVFCARLPTKWLLGIQGPEPPIAARQSMHQHATAGPLWQQYQGGGVQKQVRLSHRSNAWKTWKELTPKADIMWAVLSL